jgi:hypothetical protein
MNSRRLIRLPMPPVIAWDQHTTDAVVPMRAMEAAARGLLQPARAPKGLIGPIPPLPCGAVRAHGD